MENGYIQNETIPATEVKDVVISKISGKLASADTPVEFTQKSLAYLQTAPTSYDAAITKKEVDSLCNGTPSPLTPAEDIKTAFVITPSTIMPDQRDL